MKKKGFTLIELLAVIVILAVIALIVTPIVTSIISQAKDSANARSVEGHIKGVEYLVLEVSFKSSGNINKYDGTYTNNNVNLLTRLANDGMHLQSSDKIDCETYVVSNGLITEATGCKETEWSKTYNYTNTGGAVVAGGGSEDESTDAYTYYGYDRLNLLTESPLTTSPVYDSVYEYYYCESGYEFNETHDMCQKCPDNTVSEDTENNTCQMCPNGYSYSYGSNMCISEKKELSGDELTREGNVYYKTDGITNEVCAVFLGEQVCFSSIISYDDYTAGDYWDDYWYPMQYQIKNKMNNIGVECDDEGDGWFSCGSYDSISDETHTSYVFFEGYSGIIQCQNSDYVMSLESDGHISEYD